MNKLAIITDSSCNLDSKLQKEYGVDYVLPMHITFNGIEYDANGDWVDFSPKEYYDMMRNGAIGKSSKINSHEYEEAFKKFLDAGYDILSISCTGALSASVKESIIASEALSPLYPNQRIRCVDSANCHFSLAMIIKEADRQRKDGIDVDDIVTWIENNKLYFNEVGTVETLVYLRKAGRISASKAFFGGMLSVKPIVVYDRVGNNVAVDRRHGRRNSLEGICSYIEKYADINYKPIIYIAHGDCEQDALLVRDIIQSKYEKQIEFVFGNIEPGIGSSVGPGTIILAFYGSPEIRDLNDK